MLSAEGLLAIKTPDWPVGQAGKLASGGSSALRVMKRVFLAIVGGVWAFGAGAGVVYAAVSFGTGYYVNLCGSGTQATAYTCDPGCNPAAGRCQGSNNGVVKWTCSGKWIQCLEAEGEWADRQEIGNISCGKTIQISSFDKKCRLEDGTWDSSCNLLGYMAWYSGDCGTGTGATPTPIRVVTPTVTPRVTAGPTTRPTSTPKPTATAIPSPTAVSKLSSPTPTPRGRATPTPTAVVVCNKKCGTNADCGAGFACEAGACRNPACPADNACFCGQVKGATGSGLTPQTGAEDWLLVGGLVLAVGGGVLMKRAAAKIW